MDSKIFFKVFSYILLGLAIYVAGHAFYNLLWLDKIGKPILLFVGALAILGLKAGVDEVSSDD
jgi:hypothetical protein